MGNFILQNLDFFVAEKMRDWSLRKLLAKILNFQRLQCYLGRTLALFENLIVKY